MSSQKDKKFRVFSQSKIPHQCLFCLKSYHCYQALELHTNSHIEERPYQCNYCTANYTDFRHLYIHKDTVHLKKRYTCNQCQNNYSSPTNLYRHKRGYCTGIKTKQDTCLDRSKIELKEPVLKLERIDLPNKTESNQHKFKPLVIFDSKKISNTKYPVVVQVSSYQQDTKKIIQGLKLQNNGKKAIDNWNTSFFLHMNRYVPEK